MHHIVHAITSCFAAAAQSNAQRMVIRCARAACRWIRSVATVSVAWLTLAAVATESFAADRFRIDPDHTFAYFAVLHTGVSSLRGRMRVSSGTATLDAAQQSAEVSIELDPRTLDTGVKRLDAVLSGELFFDLARHKRAHFSGRAEKFADGMPAEFAGELTLHGISKPVRLMVDRFTCRQVKILVLERYVCGGDLHATLNRSDFGLDKYVSMVSDEVRIDISVEAIREDR